MGGQCHRHSTCVEYGCDPHSVRSDMIFRSNTWFSITRQESTYSLLSIIVQPIPEARVHYYICCYDSGHKGLVLSINACLATSFAVSLLSAFSFQFPVIQP